MEMAAAVYHSGSGGGGVLYGDVPLHTANVTVYSFLVFSSDAR